VIYVLYFLHILVSLFLILVVLLQQGKGADLSVFGGGSTMAAFGARGATTLLHKLTVGAFVIFTLTTLSIAIMQGRPSGSSVMKGSKAPATAPSESPAAPAQSAPSETPAAAPGQAAPEQTPPPPPSTPAEPPASPPAQ
jgi:preprotein translocase subunit SecG